jgi:hypothetical protein
VSIFFRIVCAMAEDLADGDHVRLEDFPSETERVEMDVEVDPTPPKAPAPPADESHVRSLLVAYGLASTATTVKTVAWWVNQWPVLAGRPFWVQWAVSAAVAGLEYAPMTLAMGLAVSRGVSLSLLTAFMEALDNLLRMVQQWALGKELQWFDWVAAAVLVACVCFQGVHHRRHERTVRKAPSTHVTSVRHRLAVAAALGLLVAVPALATLSTVAGWTGKAYALASVATLAKTFAWWINQYPGVRHQPFAVRWVAGWGIAAVVEYCPLVGAMAIASQHAVHLGLLTAFMEAFDNVCRMMQMRLLNHPLQWYDWGSAGGMVLAVAFQGLMHANGAPDAPPPPPPPPPP